MRLPNYATTRSARRTCSQHVSYVTTKSLSCPGTMFAQWSEVQSAPSKEKEGGTMVKMEEESLHVPVGPPAGSTNPLARGNDGICGGRCGLHPRADRPRQ